MSPHPEAAPTHARHHRDQPLNRKRHARTTRSIGCKFVLVGAKDFQKRSAIAASGTTDAFAVSRVLMSPEI
jgi:hypothetical protein